MWDLDGLGLIVLFLGFGSGIFLVGRGILEVELSFLMVEVGLRSLVLFLGESDEVAISLV